MNLPEFLLPFRPSGEVVISQGWNGPWSHQLLERTLVLNGHRFKQTVDRRYAVDFLLPLGSDVLAARDGIVLLGDDSTENCYEGLDPAIGNNTDLGPTNYLAIIHPDKLISVYSHLQRNSIRFRKGQNVRAGEVVAETGRSGWIGPTPHLHFQVIDKGNSSAMFTISDYSGPLDHSHNRGQEALYPDPSLALTGSLRSQTC